MPGSMPQHPQSPIARQIQRLKQLRHLLASEDDLTPSTRVGFRKLQQRLAVQAAASKERNAQLLQAVEAAGQQDSENTVTANVQLCALRAAYMALVNRTLPSWCEAVAAQLEQLEHSQHLDSHSYSMCADSRTVQQQQHHHHQPQQCARCRWGLQDKQQQQQCDIIDCAQHPCATIAAGPLAGVQVTPAVPEQLTQTLAEQSILLQHLLQQQQQQQCALGANAITSWTARTASPLTGTVANTACMGFGQEPKWQQPQEQQHAQPESQAEVLHLSVFGSDLFARRKHHQQLGALHKREDNCNACGTGATAELHHCCQQPQQQRQEQISTPHVSPQLRSAPDQEVLQQQQQHQQFTTPLLQQLPQQQQQQRQQQRQPSLRTIEELELGQRIDCNSKHDQLQQQSPQEPWQQSKQQLSGSGVEVALAAEQQQPQLVMQADEQVCMPTTQTLGRCTSESHRKQQQQRTRQGSSDSKADISILTEPTAAPHSHFHMQSEGMYRDSSCSSSNAYGAVADDQPSTGQDVAGGGPADAAAVHSTVCGATEMNTMIAGTLQQLDSTESSDASMHSVLSPSQLHSSSSVVSYGEGHGPTQVEKSYQHLQKAELGSSADIADSSPSDLEDVQEAMAAAAQAAEHQGGAVVRGGVSATVHARKPATPPPVPPLPAQLPTAVVRRAGAAAETTAGAAAAPGPHMCIPQLSAAHVSHKQQQALKVFAAAAAVAGKKTATVAVQAYANADTPLTANSVADCSGSAAQTNHTGAKQLSSSSLAMSLPSNVASVAGKGQQLGLSSLTASLGSGTTAAAAAAPAAAGTAASRCSTGEGLTAGAAMCRTSSHGAAATATAYPSISFAEDSAGAAAALGPVSIAHSSMLLSPATRLSLGAAGHDVTSPSGRQSLSSESEVEGGSRRSIGAASNGSTGRPAIARLAPELHIPAVAVVPGGRGSGASSRSVSRTASGTCSTADTAAVASRVSVAGIGTQLLQQQTAVKGPLTANAPKLPVPSLAILQLLGQQQGATAPDPPLQRRQQQQQLVMSSRTASGNIAVVDSQAHQVAVQAAAAAAAPESAAVSRTNGAGSRSIGGGFSTRAHVLAAPSNAQLMSKVLDSGLTEFGGSDSDGDEDVEVATAPAVGRAVGFVGKAASAFESDEFD